jgi:hypothetical protein
MAWPSRVELWEARIGAARRDYAPVAQGSAELNPS